MLITDPLKLHASQDPKKIAIHTPKQKMTYAQLYNQVSLFADQLYQYKQKNPMDTEYKIAILLPNSVNFFVFFLAAGMAGWIAAPFDPKWSDPELAATIESCQPQILIVDDVHADRLATLSLPPNLQVIHSLTFSPQSPKRKEREPVSDRRPFYMGFTSGTTGKPKGFLRSHRSWVKSFEGCQIAFGLNLQDFVLIPGPLVHSHFLCAAVYALHTGATVFLLEKFSPGKLIDALTQYPISALYMVPSMFEALFAELDQKNPRFSGNSIRQIISSGAKWNAAPKQKIRKWFPNCQLFEYYGASELSFVTVLNPTGNETKPNSVGRPFPGVVVAIRDENGLEVRSGQIGKLFVQSELVFLGYCGHDEDTKQVLHANGWATVHDLAWKDEDGYIFLAGREKNMIIYGGLNVFPEEVEKVLEELPQIEKAVVFGKPDDYWGEKIAAAIRYKENEALKPWEVQAHCRKHLAAYKCPREILELKEIPYTSSGKIARSLLKDMLVKGAQE